MLCAVVQRATLLTTRCVYVCGCGRYFRHTFYTSLARATSLSQVYFRNVPDFRGDDRAQAAFVMALQRQQPPGRLFRGLHAQQGTWTESGAAYATDTVRAALDVVRTGAAWAGKVANRDELCVLLEKLSSASRALASSLQALRGDRVS